MQWIVLAAAVAIAVLTFLYGWVRQATYRNVGRGPSFTPRQRLEGSILAASLLVVAGLVLAWTGPWPWPASIMLAGFVLGILAWGFVQWRWARE